MGVSHHAILDLEAPFESVQELTTLIPKERDFLVGNGTFKIIIALNGRVSLRVAPKFSCVMEERDVVVLPEPCMQFYEPLGGGDSQVFQTLVILFDRKKIFEAPQSWGDTLAARAAALCRERFREPTKIPGEKIQDLQKQIAQIRDESESRLSGKYIRINALLCTLLVDLVRAAEANPGAEPSVKRSRRLLVHQAEEFMLKNIGRPITVGEIAWHLKMSQEHLSRIFRKETGYTLKPYLSILRANHAKTLLLHSNMTITEISEKCGFSTHSLFYRTFRRIFELTPSDYRKQSQAAQTQRFMERS